MIVVVDDVRSLCLVETILFVCLQVFDSWELVIVCFELLCSYCVVQ